MNLTEHNERVRALAEKMPTPTLRNAIYAIGYVAGKDTGTVDNYTVRTLAGMSARRFGGRYKISRSSLWNAISVFRELKVVTVTATKRRLPGGKIANNRIAMTLDYNWNSNATELAEAMRRKRAGRRQPQVVPKPAVMADTTEPGGPSMGARASHDKWECAKSYYQNFTCPICLPPEQRRLPT